MGALVIWSALSSFWSGSIELSVIEADRVLVYLGFFLPPFSLPKPQRRERFAEGIAIGLAIVALAGLGSRLLPNVIDVTEGIGSGARLRYPLGYWNANATMCGIAVAMLLWLSRGSRWGTLRWLSVAALPAVLLTLYFTYSRGGLIALAVACLCLLALSADRLWLLGTLGVGGLGTLPALLAVQARNGLADNSVGQATVDQGVTVLLILLGGIALSLALFALLRRLEQGAGRARAAPVRLAQPGDPQAGRAGCGGPGGGRGRPGRPSRLGPVLELRHPDPGGSLRKLRASRGPGAATSGGSPWTRSKKSR